MADFIKMDAAEVERQIERLISDYPELAEDESLKADMLEGATNLHAVLSRIVDHRLEALEMIAGIKERSFNLKDRLGRYERRAEAMAAFALRLMTAAGQSKISLPEATLSVSKGRASVVIDDLSALPQGTFSTERKADKTAIKAQIDAGEDVPGAHIEMGDQSLTMRTK